VWQCYVIGYPEWFVNGLYAPYYVEARDEEGKFLFSGTYISGTGPWADPDTIRPVEGIEIQQFAQLINGLIVPTTQFGFVWISYDINEPPETRLVEWTNFRDTVKANYTGDISVVGDPCDKWDEFCYRFKIQNVEHLSSQLEALTAKCYIPPGVNRFTPGSVPSLYKDVVPKTTEAGVGIDTPHGEWVKPMIKTDYVAVRTLPGASVSAFLQIKVDASIFDSWVYRPAYGIPKILDVNAPEAIDGGSGIVQVIVKNVGPTGDSFFAKISYPQVVVEQSPGWIYIPPGEERVFQFVVSKGETEINRYDLTGTISVIARDSGESTSAEFRQTWVGGASEEGREVSGYGSIHGAVFDSSTNTPIQGAVVSCGGKYDTTDAGGVFQISSIPTGSQKLIISASGYVKFTADVTVEKDVNKNVGSFYLSPVKPTEFPTGLVVGFIVAVVGVCGVLVYARRRGLIG